ncbi:MAG TPA: hypothetical protein VGE15_06225 [Sphingobacteriaceae bacterium]
MDKWRFFQDHNLEWRWERKSVFGLLVGASDHGFKLYSECRDNALFHGFFDRSSLVA